MSENGTIHITMVKNWVSYILFSLKRGRIVYLAAVKKVAREGMSICLGNPNG